MNARSPEQRPSEELRPWTLAEVIQRERRALRSADVPTPDLPRRELPSPDLREVVNSIHEETRANPAAATAALCFSGGGIRSATFGLGVLQALARSGMLPRFDYLSTVSGGGYLGSWLSAWIHREGNPERVFSSLANANEHSIESPEAPQLQHLRRYSNYLAPRLSLASADTWALAGIFVRNLVLNWLILLPLLLVLMILPRFFIAGVQTDAGWISITAACVAAGIGLFVSTWYSATDLPSNGGRRGSDISFLGWRLLPLVIGAHALALAWAWVGNGMDVPPIVDAMAKSDGVSWEVYNLPSLAAIFTSSAGEKTTFYLPAFPLGLFAIVVVFPILLGSIGGESWRRARKHGEQGDGIERRLSGWRARFGRMAALALSSFIGAAGIGLLARYLFPMPKWDVVNYTAFSPTLILAVFLIANFLVPGFTSWASTESDREWWGRSSGWTLAAVIASAAIGTVVFKGPVWLSSLEKWFSMETIYASLGGISGLLGILSALFGSSSDTEAKPSRRRLGPKLLSFGAIAFALLVGMYFSFFIDRWVAETYNLTFNTGGSGTLWKTAFIACALASVALLMGFLVNVNRFSMHMMYRNRLVRAYLGASRKTDQRQPHRFTGFDDDDDVRLHDLGTQRPLHIVNIALNLVSGANLAWQERRAQSFTASALHSGAWQINRGQPSPGAFQPSRFYGNSRGLGLGTSFSISGAAANPNCGYHSSPIVTLLMTLFNLRLGWWLPNPGLHGSAHWQRSGPNFALTPLLAEAFGLTTEKRSFVNLSDGGHFDNMGLYEMLLRRCHYIVVVDGEQDGLYSFAGLSEALRKARIDLGIEVEIDLRRIADDQSKCCTVGSIRYSAIDGDNASDGWLLYIKPVIMGSEPADIRHYRSRNGAFPHESTGDQFFSESQFESYRALGEHLGSRASLEQEHKSLAALFAAAAAYAECLDDAQLARLRGEIPPDVKG